MPGSSKKGLLPRWTHTSKNKKRARHMLEVHQKGRSILWSGVREPAEFYVQQLHGYLLLATLEKVV